LDTRTAVPHRPEVHCAVGEGVVIVRTENVLNAAVNAGVRRIIHVSSVSVYGGANGDVTEATAPPPGTLAGYGASKVAAEQVCQQDGGDWLGR
jgi:nucleoside-diphosphate-sugar epimerase